MNDTATQTCRHCGVEIACVDDVWLDVETVDDPDPAYCAFGFFAAHFPDDPSSGRLS